MIKYQLCMISPIRSIYIYIYIRDGVVKTFYDDVINHQMGTFSALLALVWGIHRSPVNSPHKGQWRGALMFSLMRARINGWVNNREAGDWRRHRTHYDVSIMLVCFAAIIVQLIYIEQCHFNLPFPIPIQFRIVDDWPNWRNLNLQAKQMWYILVEMRLKYFSVITSVIADVALCVDCACMCFIDVFPDCVLFQNWLNKNKFILFRSIHRC